LTRLADYCFGVLSSLIRLLSSDRHQSNGYADTTG